MRVEQNLDLMLTYYLLCSLIITFIVIVFLIRKNRCYLRIKKENETYIASIIKGINAYIMLVDMDFQVLKTNFYFKQNLVGPNEPRRIGEVLRCKNGIDAHRCGGHELCKSCPIRGAINKAFKEEKGFSNLEASMTLYLNDRNTQYIDAYFTISANTINIEDKIYLLLTINDVTQLKQIQIDLEKQKKKAQESDKLKTAFLANISHEIRTPLNAITGFSHLLSYTKDEEEQQEYIKIIDQNNELLLHLLNDIFDLAKIESGSVEFEEEPINLSSLFEEVKSKYLYTLKNEKVNIVFNYSSKDIQVQGDKNRIMQVLDNFITNAIKFTNEGTITVGYEEKESDIYCYVEDTGIGLSESEKEKTFERFMKVQDNNKPGSGLGLYISKTIIKHMNGRIGVASEQGKGSCFWFTLPK